MPGRKGGFLPLNTTGREMWHTEHVKKKGRAETERLIERRERVKNSAERENHTKIDDRILGFE